jgi:transketolase
MRHDQIDHLCLHTFHTLSMDTVQQAKSGHPSAPMALAQLKELQRKFGFEPDRVAAVAKELPGKA